MEVISITILFLGLIIVIVGLVLYGFNTNMVISGIIIFIGLFFMILSIFLTYYLRPIKQSN